MKTCAALLFTLVACGGDSSRPEPTVCDHHAGGGLADFDVPCDPGAGGVFITASGEAFAKNGYAFPPASPDDVVFVDGWALTYDRVLTTVDHVTLSTGPDTVPTDQSQCADATGKPIKCGPASDVVAEIDGPFALDLHVGGPLPDADGADMDATPIGALTGANKESNDAFDPTSKYGFGFETVPATMGAKNVNLDAAAIADYTEMAQKHYTTMLVGTATWQGNAQGDLVSDLGLHADDAVRLQRDPEDDQVPAGVDRADGLSQRAEPRADGRSVPERGAPARRRHRRECVDDRAGHTPPRPRVLGELRARLPRALRPVRGEGRRHAVACVDHARGLQGLRAAGRSWMRRATTCRGARVCRPPTTPRHRPARWDSTR